MTFISRRDLLKRVGMTSIAVPLFDRAFQRAPGVPLTNFTPGEGRLMDAIVARLIPTDDSVRAQPKRTRSPTSIARSAMR